MPEKKSAKKDSAAAREPAGNGKAVVYLGPPITGVAMPGTVYRNGLTPQLQKAVEEIPALKRLLVETVRVGQVRKDLRTPQSAAAICYREAVECIRRKGAKG